MTPVIFSTNITKVIDENTAQLIAKGQTRKHFLQRTIHFHFQLHTSETIFSLPSKQAVVVHTLVLTGVN